MSLISSLYIGQNGLSTTSLELGVVGDNVANAGTIGFKAGRASFADLVGENLVGGGGQLGLGSRLIAVQKILTQGALATTGVSTDLAISGPGHFVVRMPNGQLAYTRNGQFTLDQDGFMVDLQGNRVQGFPADTAGALGGVPSNLQVGQATSPPTPTTTITVRANLDSTQPAIPTGFDPTDATTIANTTTFSSTTQVFDSLGRPIDVTIHYTKVGDGQWQWNAVIDGANQQGGTAGTPVVIAGGTLNFNTDGQLDAVGANPSSFLPAGATAPQDLTFDFGNPLAAGGDGSGVTQFAASSATSFIGQDGFGAGELAAISIGTDGVISGSFTNGQTRALGQVVLADFPAPDKLDRLGDNLFAQSNLSGEPNIGAPTTGGRGKLFSGALEQSNVDVATELVRMIVVQRNFQANSKTVSTADQMLAELIQIKR
jgi:flagellar hook protein FlgE